MVLCCGLVGLSFLAIVGFGLLQRIQAAENTLLERQVSSAPTKIQPKLPPMLPVQTAQLDRGPAFIENRGQFNEKARYQVRIGGKTLWVTKEGIVFDVLRPKQTGTTESGLGASSPLLIKDARLRVPGPLFNPTSKIENPKPADLERLVFSQEFIGANPTPALEASGSQPGIYNYFIGNDPKKWVTHVNTFSRVLYRDLWPGIDLRLEGNDVAPSFRAASAATGVKSGTTTNTAPGLGPSLEQDFIVHPGADLSRLQVTYKGIDKLELAKDGALIVHTAFGDLRELKPRIYQEIAGRRAPVEGRFKLASKMSYTFEVKNYNPQYALVVDPTLLYSTFLGGSSADTGYGIAVDSSGSAYIIGTTWSSDFPTTPGAFQTTNPRYSAFVTKLNPLGSNLVYSTFLGPIFLSSPSAYAIALDSAGEAYVAGLGAANFPTTPNAWDPTFSGGYFFTKIAAGGDALVYSTFFLGGGGSPYGIAVDSSGKAYITGTVSSSVDFPITPGAFQSINRANGSARTAFLTVFDPSLSGASSLFYSSYLGGSNTDGGYSVAVDAYGEAYVTGEAQSTDFPVTPGAFQTTWPGALGVGFVAKFNPAASGASSLIYSTYLGGNGFNVFGDHVGYDTPYGIAVDGLGQAHVTGVAESVNFPTTAGAIQTLMLGEGDAFIATLNAGGNALLQSTLLGNGPSGNGIALDSFGDMFIAGVLGCNGSSVPTTPNAFQAGCGGGGNFTNAFVTELNPAGTALLYSSYLGGPSGAQANGIAVDSVGDAYVTGGTNAFNFPVTSFAFQPSYHGSGDAFVTKFPLGAPQALSVQGILPTAGGNAGTVSLEIVGGGFHAGATAQLACGGAVNISAANLSVGVVGRTLKGTFNLVGTNPGTCDLVVTNPDGSSATLPQSFTVQQGGAPNVHVHKVGTVAQKPPLDELTWSTNVTYLITVTNTGNVDGTNESVSEALDNEFSLTAVNPPAFTTTNSFILWNVPVVAPGESLQFTYSTIIDPLTPVGTTIVGGPVCLLPPLAVYSFLYCLVTSRDVSLDCTPALVDCGNAAVHCPPLIPCPVPGCIVPVPNPYFDPIACRDDLLGCADDCGNCWPDVQSCLQQASDDCTFWTQFLLGGPVDPNYLQGSTGVGAQQWISGSAALSYVLGFGNDPKATAPAQQVVVKLPLPANVNMSTVNLSGITLPSNSSAPTLQVTIPPGAFKPAAGLDEFTTNVDLRPAENLFVLVDAVLNPSTNIITWTLTSIDPGTGQPPINPGVGFLPPGAEGSVALTVAPMQALPTGTAISDEGNVVFENSGTSNPPVNTNIWSNSLDNTPPTSSVSPLPPEETSPTFTVQWSGTDIGSGIGTYNVYVSIDGAPFTVWQQNTTATSSSYTGEVGNTYGFYSIATDLVGNTEPAKSIAEATTMDVAPPAATFSPSSLTFGNEDLGTTSGSKSISLSNTGNAALTITSIVPSANFAETNNCGGSVPGGGSCTIKVTFSPTVVASPLTGTLTITDNNNGVNGSQQTVSLSGVGIGRPSVAILSTSPSLAGTTLTLTITVTNNGTGNGQNLLLNQVVPKTLGGSGTATLSSPVLPLSVGTLALGANATITLKLNVPSTVTKLSVTLDGTIQDGVGNTLSYSIASVVFP
jgi:hypothetical protein